MQIIVMKYNPITGAQYETVEAPATEIKNDQVTNAAAAYQRVQQTRKKRAAQMRKTNMKHK